MSCGKFPHNFFKFFFKASPSHFGSVLVAFFCEYFNVWNYYSRYFYSRSIHKKSRVFAYESYLWHIYCLILMIIKIGLETPEIWFTNADGFFGGQVYENSWVHFWVFYRKFYYFVYTSDLQETHEIRINKPVIKRKSFIFFT